MRSATTPYPATGPHSHPAFWTLPTSPLPPSNPPILLPQGINWQALEERRIPSSFKPPIAHSLSVENFDK